jgi:hypothetical protein
VSGSVRGHAFALEQNQTSTDDPAVTFDNDPRTYTEESDATGAKGGVSTWRYNQIEKPAIQNGVPFTQINENAALGAMGIAHPSTIRFRVQMAAGTFDDRLMDNEGNTDYRNASRPRNVAQQAHQSDMGRQAAAASPYVPPTVRHPGDDFMPADRHIYPGYMSPPPTPFLAEAETEVVNLKGNPAVGSKVHDLKGGRTGRVEYVIERDTAMNTSKCLVVLDYLDYMNPPPAPFFVSEMEDSEGDVTDDEVAEEKDEESKDQQEPPESRKRPRTPDSDGDVTDDEVGKEPPRHRVRRI